MKREEIVKKIKHSEEQLKSLRNELDNIDFEETYEVRKKFIGKCFKKIVNQNEVICHFIYELTKDSYGSLTLRTLRLNYCTDNEYHFEISEENSIIYMDSRWQEISMDEFNEHRELIYTMILKKQVQGDYEKFREKNQ